MSKHLITYLAAILLFGCAAKVPSSQVAADCRSAAGTCCGGGQVHLLSDSRAACVVRGDKCDLEEHTKICQHGEAGSMNCAGGDCQGKCAQLKCTKACFASTTCKCSVGLCTCKKG